MSINIGNAEGHLDLNVSGWNSGISSAENSLDGFMRMQEESSQDMSRIGQMFEAAGSRMQGAFDGMRTSIRGAIGDTAGLTEEAKKLQNEMSNNLRASASDFTDKLTVGLTASLAAMVALVESTEELRTDIATLENGAASAGVAFDKTNEYMRQFGAVSDEYDSNVEAMMNLFQTNLRDNELQNAIDNISGAVKAFPDTLKVESLADSLQETLETGAATGQFSELLDRAGVGAENLNNELSQTNSAFEKQQIVLDALNSTGMSEYYNNFVELNPELVRAKEIQYDLNMELARLADEAVPVINNTKEVLVNMLDAVIDNKDAIITFGGAVITGTAALKGMLIINTLIGHMTKMKAALDAAKVAQVGLNAAMKANVIGLVVTALAALAGGIAAYNIATKEASAETQTLNEKLEDNKKEIDTQKDSAIASAGKVKVLSEKYAELSNELEYNKAKGEDTTVVQNELLGIAKQLNETIPGLNIQIDNETGALSRQTNEVIDLANAYYDMQVAKAYANAYDDKIDATVKSIIDAKENIESLEYVSPTLVDGRPEKIKAKDAREKQIQIQAEKDFITEQENLLKKYSAESMKYANEVAENRAGLEKGTTEVVKKEEGKKNDAYVATRTQQTSANENAWDDELQGYEDLYDDIVKALEERNKEEEKIETKRLKDSYDIAKETSNAKIKLYEEEYLAKLKTIDAELAAELEAKQAEIDAIDAKTEAEERAMMLAEEQEDIDEARNLWLNATDAEESAKLYENYQDLIADKERRELLEKREAEKEKLEDEKEALITSATLQKEQAETEYNNLIEEENAKQAIMDEVYEDELVRIGKHYEDINAAAELQAEAILAIEEKSSEDVLALLEEYNPDWKSQGEDYVQNLIDGLSAKEGDLKSQIGKLADLYEELDEWKEAAQAQSGGTPLREGLSYVPYDGFSATLHEGERVLTKEENQALNSGANSSGDTYNFYSPKTLTPLESARQMKKAKREILGGFS